MSTGLRLNSNFFSAILILFSVLALIFYIVFVDGLGNVLEVFMSCKPFWLFFGVFLMLIYWGLECYILNRGLKIFNKKLNLANNVKNCILGQFFNNITPSATGGQPFQVFYMTRYCGLSYGTALGGLLIKFICFQFSLTFLCSIVVFLKFNYFVGKIQGFAAFMFLGFIINTVIAVLLLIIGFNRKFAGVLIGFFIKILGKLKIFRETEKKLQDACKEVDFFNENIKLAFRNTKELCRMLFLSALQLLAFYSVNVVIAFSFGIKLNFFSIFNIISGAACVQMSSTFIPLPGAVGGAEFLFFAIYDGVFVSNQLSAALLIWRLYTFYLPIIVGIIFSRGMFSRGNDI